MSDRGLIIFPDGRVDEVDDEGNTTADMAPGIWDELIEAGYPLFSDGSNPEWGEKCIDISIDDSGSVTAYSVDENPGNREYPMGTAPQRLAAWLALTKESEL